MPCYVYILRSLKDGRLYTGTGTNVAERFLDHNRGGTPSTKHRRPFELLYVEEYADRSSAMRREQHFKSLEGGSEKHLLIAKLTPEEIAEFQRKYL